MYSTVPAKELQLFLMVLVKLVFVISRLCNGTQKSTPV